MTPEIVWGAINRSELAHLIKTAFHNIHVTSPKTPGGPSSGPMWGKGMCAAAGAATAGSHVQTLSQGATPNTASPLGGGVMFATPLSPPQQDAAQKLALPIKDFCFSNVRGLTRVGGIYICIWMYMCMYMCMYTYMCIDLCVYMYIDMCVYIYI